MNKLYHHAFLTGILLIFIDSVQANSHLDRLFTTKSQRDSLNTLRTRPAIPKTTSPAIQGYVKRSDGKATWWLDNKPSTEQQEAANYDTRHR